MPTVKTKKTAKPASTNSIQAELLSTVAQLQKLQNQIKALPDDQAKAHHVASVRDALLILKGVAIARGVSLTQLGA